MYPEQPVDPNQIMEDTQVVDWDAEEEEEETERSSNSLGYSLEPIGRLLVFGGTHGPQKDCPLYIGNNVIGRSPDCSVVLPFPSISKRHAMIEIPAWNKAALLQDCGSLNGTRIMRPPKILTSGINHCLRNKDLILLADLPCQYYRLNIPLPLVSRIPLTIEETPRVQGGTQPSRILLAEDSEEEVDFLSERCVVNEPRTTSSPLTTVVPESDEEGLSAAPGVPGPSFVAFDLVSDTDEEEDQPPEAGEASSAAREGTVVEAEQPDEMTSGIQQVKVRATVQRYKNRKVKTDAGSDVVPLGVIRERSHLPREDSDTDMDEERNPPGRRPARAHLERAQPSGIVDSDTDAEEEGIPVTPAVVPVKKRQILCGVDPEDVCLPATQCFVKIEPQSPETVQTLEDEPTQAFPLTLPQEPGPTHCSLPTQGHLNSKTPPAESASRVTRSRTNRSSVKTSEPVVSMGPEIQPPTYIDQPVSPEPMSWASRGRAHKSSVMTPKPIIPMIPELQPLMSREESVTPKPRSRATRSRTCKKSSTKTPESGGRTPPELEPSASTNQPVIPEATDQNKTLRSSTLSATLVPIIPELQTPAATAQPAPLEPRNSKRKRAARKQGSHVAPIGQRPSSVTPEPESQSSNQRSGVLSAAESRGTIPEPALHQLPEAHTHAPLTQNVEEAGRSGVILEPKPETSQICKRTSTTMASSLLQKRPRRGVSQKIALSSGGDDSATRLVKEEDVVVPEPDKSRRDQAEEGPKANPSRNLRRNKPNQEPAAPKVLFTGVVDARGERAVLALGGSLATSVNEASHLVTDRIRRTVKFLCALGKGIPILSLDWLYQSRKAGCFLPPDEYLVTDPEQEKNFSFSLRDALTRAQERKLLEGYEIHVTAGVQPTPPQMGEIINCCGGTVLTSMPRSYKPHRVVVTCPQDIPRCSIPSRLGLPLVSPEFLLTGVLKQEATPEAFLLSNLQSHPPENSSTFTTQRNCRK